MGDDARPKLEAEPVASVSTEPEYASDDHSHESIENSKNVNESLPVTASLDDRAHTARKGSIFSFHATGGYGIESLENQGWLDIPDSRQSGI